MDKLVIEGGTPLRGTVRISGAKNAALPILFGTLLHAGSSRVRNLPDLVDIRTTLELLEAMGVQVQHDGPEVRIDATELTSVEAPYELVRKMRASVLCLGPLVARFGDCRVSLPGGCAIGTRPVDQHLKALEAMGAAVELEQGYIHAVAPDGGELVLVGYDDLWSLPEHPVYFAGERSSLRRELSGMFARYYAALRVRSATSSETSRYRFVDVRGWLGEDLWTNDGIHMLHENYEAQAKLLWNGEFHEALGCDRVGADGSSG